MFHQASADLDQAQTCQRPAPNLLRQHQSSPEIPQAVADHAQPQTHFISAELMAGKTGQFAEASGWYHEAHEGKWLPGVKLDLRHYSTRRPSTGRLVEKTLVAHHRLWLGRLTGHVTSS